MKGAPALGFPPPFMKVCTMTNETTTCYIGHLIFIERSAAAPLVGLDRCLLCRDPDTNDLVQDGAFTPKPRIGCTTTPSRPRASAAASRTSASTSTTTKRIVSPTPR